MKKTSTIQNKKRIIISVVGLLLLVVTVIPNLAKAQIPPVLQANINVRNISTGGGFSNFVISQPGQRLEVLAEVINPSGSEVATGISAKVTIPSTTITNGNLNLQVTASNAASVSSTTTVQIFGSGGNLFYVPGSTRVTWDTSGDGIHEYLNTVWQDGIAGSGLAFGNVLGGGNTTKVRITFLVDVLAPGQQPSPVPTPTPSQTPPNGQPTPTPPQPTGNQSGGTSSQSQTSGSQTINVNPVITNTNNVSTPIIASENGTAVATTSGKVLGAKTELPKTGTMALIGVSFAFFSMIAFGILTRRFGDIKISKFALPYAQKVYRGDDLTPSDLVNNRAKIKSIR